MIPVLCCLLFAGCKANQAGNKVQKTTAGGNVYYELKPGEGTPGKPGDVLVFHMTQSVDDSLLMDSRTMGRPQKYPIPEPGSRPFQSVEEILFGLKKGDSIDVVMKMDTMSQKPPGIEGEFFHIGIEITDIETKEAMEERARLGKEREAKVAESTNAVIAAYTAGTLKDIQTDPSGLKYVIHEEGSGEHPKAGQNVKVNYYGALTDGSMFDNSFGRGEAFEFGLGQGQVIQGWDKGVPLLKKGGSATLFIPYEMAYGEAGRPPSIPEKAELVFFVELLDMN